MNVTMVCRVFWYCYFSTFTIVSFTGHGLLFLPVLDLLTIWKPRAQELKHLSYGGIITKWEKSGEGLPPPPTQLLQHFIVAWQGKKKGHLEGKKEREMMHNNFENGT